MKSYFVMKVIKLIELFTYEANSSRETNRSIFQNFKKYKLIQIRIVRIQSEEFLRSYTTV